MPCMWYFKKMNAIILYVCFCGNAGCIYDISVYKQTFFSVGTGSGVYMFIFDVGKVFNTLNNVCRISNSY